MPFELVWCLKICFVLRLISLNVSSCYSIVHDVVSINNHSQLSVISFFPLCCSCRERPLHSAASAVTLHLSTFSSASTLETVPLQRSVSLIIFGVVCRYNYKLSFLVNHCIPVIDHFSCYAFYIGVTVWPSWSWKTVQVLGCLG